MIRLRLPLGCFCVALLGVIPACAGKTKPDTRFAHNTALFAAIDKADSLTLYEGLPHPGNEPDVFARELQKPSLTLHGHAFYVPPLTVSADDRDKLRAVLGDERAFLQWRGEKKCGGFHPDYCAEWQAAGQTYRVLICFGCSEIQVYGQTSNLWCDMQNDTIERLKELLKPHRKHRLQPKE